MNINKTVCKYIIIVIVLSFGGYFYIVNSILTKVSTKLEIKEDQRFNLKPHKLSFDIRPNHLKSKVFTLNGVNFHLPPEALLRKKLSFAASYHIDEYDMLFSQTISKEQIDNFSYDKIFPDIPFEKFVNRAFNTTKPTFLNSPSPKQAIVNTTLFKIKQFLLAPGIENFFGRFKYQGRAAFVTRPNDNTYSFLVFDDVAQNLVLIVISKKIEGDDFKLENALSVLNNICVTSKPNLADAK